MSLSETTTTIVFIVFMVCVLAILWWIRPRSGPTLANEKLPGASKMYWGTGLIRMLSGASPWEPIQHEPDEEEEEE